VGIGFRLSQQLREVLHMLGVNAVVGIAAVGTTAGRALMVIDVHTISMTVARLPTKATAPRGVLLRNP
jgi:hypothetical protein